MLEEEQHKNVGMHNDSGRGGRTEVFACDETSVVMAAQKQTPAE